MQIGDYKIQTFEFCKEEYKSISSLKSATKIVEGIETQIEWKTTQMEKFQENFSSFEAYINDLFSEFEYELVVYDEVEYFKKYTHPEFYYPYQRRKTKVGTYSLNITLDRDTYDYEYFSKTVSFQ